MVSERGKEEVESMGFELEDEKEEDEDGRDTMQAEQGQREYSRPRHCFNSQRDNADEPTYLRANGMISIDKAPPW